MSRLESWLWWLLRNAGVFWLVDFGVYDDMKVKEACVNYLELKRKGRMRWLHCSASFEGVEYPSIIITKLVYYNYY